MTEKPNLLFIHSDQHSPFVSGCYGDPLVQTPNLDRLAASGVICGNAYCPSPICVPSRMAALTGCYPHQVKVWSNQHVLDSGIPTIAHSMGAAGYHPVLIGRMHSLGPDQLHGYAERLVGDHRPNYPGGKPVDHGEFEGTQDPGRISLTHSGSGQSAYQVHDEYVTAATVDYLNRIGIERKCGNGTYGGADAHPFCLTVGFMLPHQPFIAREEDYSLYEGKMVLPKIQDAYSDSLHPYLKKWREDTGISKVTDEEILRARTAYWALVTRLDTMIGDILTALERNGLDKNTLIIYTSDHGEQVGEHSLWWKQTFYEASVRIPMILSWPGVIAGGRRMEQVLGTLDLSATILDALDAPALPRSVGRSFLPLLISEDSQLPWHNEVLSEFCTDDGVYQRMVRSGDWKLIYYHGYDPQLFNLAEDPDECMDRAHDPECEGIKSRLLARVLQDWDPEAIDSEMKLKKQECDILHDWASKVLPTDTYRWAMTRDMHFLNAKP
jgi:choline-sulfatase